MHVFTLTAEPKEIEGPYIPIYSQKTYGPSFPLQAIIPNLETNRPFTAMTGKLTTRAVIVSGNTHGHPSLLNKG